MAELWFKRHRYGFGWTPATWQAWVATMGTLLLAIIAAVVLATVAPQDEWWPVALYLIIVLLCVAGLVWASVTHGPAPRWRWGRRPGDDPDEDF